MSRVPNVARGLPISAKAAIEIASIVARERFPMTGIRLDPEALAAAVLSDLEGWKPSSFNDSGREAVTFYFEKHVRQMEESPHG